MDVQPLYAQIREILKQEIINGKRVVGEQLPNEEELCQGYNVCRITLRRAIEQLQSEGLVKKIHGKGTFVIANQIKQNTRKIWKMIISDHPLFKELVLVAEYHAHQYGYDIILASIETADIETHVRRGEKNEIAGYFFMPDFSGPLDSQENQRVISILSELRAKKVPFVLVNRSVKRYQFDTVDVDDYLGGLLATNHLVEHRFQKIAYLAWPSHLKNYLRLAGYEDALKKQKIKKRIVKKIRQWDGNWGYQEAKELILEEKPQAIFAFGDWIAVRVLYAARDLGVKVPEELAVVGYDDLNDSLVPSVALTSINQNFREIGRVASELLVRRLQGDWSGFPEKVRVNPSLVIRQSCGCHSE